MTMNKLRQTTRLGTLALSGVLLLASQTAFPEEGERPGRVDVIGTAINVQDVDLSTTQGARWLYRRIVSAAKAVCWNSVERHGGVVWLRTQETEARRCFDGSVNDALAKVSATTGLNIEQLAGLDRYDEAVASR